VRKSAGSAQWVTTDVAMPIAVCPTESEGLSMLVLTVGHGRTISGAFISEDGEAANEKGRPIFNVPA
jgi:hypothetical protein